MESRHLEKSHSKLEWFFYIIFLPFLFTIILTGIILMIFKVDVVNGLLEVGNRIPIVKEWVPEPKVREVGIDENESPEKKLAAYQKTLADKNANIDELIKELEKRDAEINDLSERMSLLEGELLEKNASDEERAEYIKKIVKLYSTMTPSKAANIISNLNTYEAVLVLGEMNERVASDILAKMEPKQAATLSMLLKETVYSSDLEIQALQERIDELKKELDEAKYQAEKDKNRDVPAAFADTLKSLETMEVNAAGEILSKMWEEGNKKDVTSLMKAMEATTRSNILASMKPELAAKILTTLVDN